MNLNEKLSKKINNGDRFYSFEVHPPKTEEDVDKFLRNVHALCATTDPLFLSLTWHKILNPHELCRRNSSLSLATMLDAECQAILMPHLTSDVGSFGMLEAQINNFKHLNIHNVFVLAGDSSLVRGATNVNCQANFKLSSISSTEFVRWISTNYSDMIVAVAGYPDTHPKASSRSDDISNLRQKVESGAHLIITQFFFRLEAFASFLRECRQAGITVPIIPGIFLFKSSAMLLKMARMSKIDVPTDVLETLQKYGNNTDLMEKYALHLAYELSRNLLSSKLSQGIHIFTMNQTENAKILLNRLGFVSGVDVCERRLLSSSESCDQNDCESFIN